MQHTTIVALQAAVHLPEFRSVVEPADTFTAKAPLAMSRKMIHRVPMTLSRRSANAASVASRHGIRCGDVAAVVPRE